MEDKKDIRWLKRFKWNYLCIGIVFLIFVLIILCVLYNFKGDRIIALIKGCKSVATDVDRFCDKCFDSKNHVMDFLYLIWGMTISFVIFFMEIRNDYWYGVNLKKIIELSFENRSLLYILSGIYVGLCPVVTFAEILELYVTALAGVLVIFGGFLLTLVFVMYSVQMEHIRRLLKKSTIYDLIKLTEDQRPEKNEYIQVNLERLPIMYMVENSDYKKLTELDYMTETFSTLFLDEEFKNIISDNYYDFAFLITYSEKVLLMSGFDTEEQIDRSLYILRELWTKIICRMGNDGQENCSMGELKNLKILYSVCIILPLIRKNCYPVRMMLSSLLKVMGELKTGMLLYIALYIEFLYREQPEVFFEDSISPFDMVKIPSVCLVRESMDNWDVDLAIKMWCTLMAMRNLGQNTGASFLNDFLQDVKNIADNRIDQFRSYTIKRIFMEGNWDE